MVDDELRERVERLEALMARVEPTVAPLHERVGVRYSNREDVFYLVNSGVGGHIQLQSAELPFILANARYHANGGHERFDPSAASGLLRVDDFGVYHARADAGTGQISWGEGDFLQKYQAPTTDANGWTVHAKVGGYKGLWTRRVKVTAGFPASTAYASMATLNLPVGVSSLADVDVLWSARADTWARVLLFGYDATDASTSIVFHGTVTDGVNWSAKGIAEVCFDVLLVER